MTQFFPTLEEILHLHNLLIQRFGGAAGVRDMGMVESALARAQSGYYQSLSQQGAAMLQSFATNHGVVDGNKRIAFASCAVFLQLNGFTLVVQAEEAESFLIDKIIGSHIPLEGIAQWLEKHMTPIS